MRVLVTRPEPVASATAARLQALGHTPLVAPLLDVVALNATIPDRPYAAVLVTSANALRALTKHSTPGRLIALPLFAVGPRTAEDARAAGFVDVTEGPGDAVTLAHAVGAALTPDHGPLLYLAGRDRTGALEAALRRYGFDVELVELYAAETSGVLPEVARAALAAGEVDAVLLASRRTAQAFHRGVAAAGLESALRRVRLVTLSAAVAEVVRALGAPVVIAAEAHEDALLAAVGQDAPDMQTCLNPGAGHGDAGMADETGKGASGGRSSAARRTRAATSDAAVMSSAAPAPAPAPFLIEAPAPAPAPAAAAVPPFVPPAAAKLEPDSQAIERSPTARGQTAEPPKPPPEAVAEPSASPPPPRPTQRAESARAAPVAAPPPISARRYGLAAASGGVIGALLVLLGGLAANQFGLLTLGRPVDRGPELRALADRLTAVESDRTRLQALEQAVPRIAAGERAAADLAPLGARLGEISGRVDRLGADLGAAQAGLAETRTSLRTLDERLTQLALTPAQPSGAPAADALAQDVNRLRQALAGIDQRLGRVDTTALETGLREVRSEVARLGAAAGQGVPRTAAVAAGLAALKSAVARGGSFRAELDALASLGLTGAEMDQLAARAGAGAPTDAALLARLRALTRPMLEATRPRGEGLLDQIAQSAGRLVTIRPIGESPGNDPAAVLTRIEARLAAGDVAGAHDAFRTLPETARTAGAALSEAFTARREIDRLVEAVTAAAQRGPARG